RGNGGVVVEDGQQQGFQHNGFSEARSYGQHRRAGEIQFAFRVAVDVPAETVVGQPVQRAVVDDRGGGELLELGVAETEVEYGVQCARDATDDAVPPAVRQPTCEQFEHAVPLGGPAGQCPGEQGEVGVIGQQRGRGDPCRG